MSLAEIAVPVPVPALFGDDDNRVLATSREAVDEVNALFYGKIKYPWAPAYFETVRDERFWPAMLDQEVGRRHAPVVPAGGRVWVAGCGTNQALITALRFPGATVVGSDLSAESLELCGEHARQIGVENLELRRESIHQAGYEGEFDYVLCTGVIHHNADPQATLARLAAALRPAGMLQLMVYNRYHRTLTTAFQKAVRALVYEGSGAYSYERELDVAMRFVKTFDARSPMTPFLAGMRDAPAEHVADALIQPVEHSYTVESVEQMAHACALELVQPWISPFDVAESRTSWEAPLVDGELQALYDALPDTRRWQVSNLLLADESPMLWFHLQRAGSPHPRRTVAELCDEFLATVHAPAQATRRIFFGDEDTGAYAADDFSDSPFPGVPRDDEALRVHRACDGITPMRAVLARLGIAATPRTVDRLRIHLASTAFPYLRAV